MSTRKQINVAIPGDELERLRELSSDLGQSQSETVRALINNAYNSEIVRSYLKTTNAEMAARDALKKAGLDPTSYNVHCGNKKGAPWKQHEQRQDHEGQTRSEEIIAKDAANWDRKMRILLDLATAEEIEQYNQKLIPLNYLLIKYRTDINELMNITKG